ncbi:hypothetical protein DY000_02021330 [Brassica cretica]|uniref:DUF7870 domain-containing protein n=1 Tax=Brassica cretica TaxID=69181 RepID=A0ABQ7EF57_BRACR|nr:hypothetical protein DY000_02021330 [Brassica cretica]
MSLGTGWFVNNYPTKNLKFEMYKIEMVNGEMSLEPGNLGMKEWLKENVKEEEHVVMKVEVRKIERKPDDATELSSSPSIWLSSPSRSSSGSIFRPPPFLHQSNPQSKAALPSTVER